MNILVVEDEQNLADAICKILKDADYDAQAAYDGNTGLDQAQSGNYDGIVLDVMLPGIDGMEIVRTLRKDNNNVPILMLTARTTTQDKVSGLDAGADDYMTKPFEADELLARVRSITRRTGDVVVDDMSYGDISLDTESHDLSCNGRSVHLSQKEYDVLCMLVSAQGRVVSKQDLLKKVWGADADASENSAEAYVSFLRKKLGHVKSKLQIATLRMLGYRLEMTNDEN